MLKNGEQLKLYVLNSSKKLKKIKNCFNFLYFSIFYNKNFFNFQLGLLDERFTTFILISILMISQCIYLHILEIFNVHFIAYFQSDKRCPYRVHIFTFNLLHSLTAFFAKIICTYWFFNEKGDINNKITFVLKNKPFVSV